MTVPAEEDNTKDMIRHIILDKITFHDISTEQEIQALARLQLDLMNELELLKKSSTSEIEDNEVIDLSFQVADKISQTIELARSCSDRAKAMGESMRRVEEKYQIRPSNAIAIETSISTTEGSI